MPTILNPTEPIAVEYDCRGERRVKTFDDAYMARRFYGAKLRLGKHPKVRRPEK